MKITKTQLRQIIKEEVEKEIASDENLQELFGMFGGGKKKKTNQSGSDEGGYNPPSPEDRGKWNQYHAKFSDDELFKVNPVEWQARKNREIFKKYPAKDKENKSKRDAELAAVKKKFDTHPEAARINKQDAKMRKRPEKKFYDPDRTYRDSLYLDRAVRGAVPIEPGTEGDVIRRREQFQKIRAARAAKAGNRRDK